MIRQEIIPNLNLLSQIVTCDVDDNVGKTLEFGSTAITLARGLEIAASIE